jgi:hypothetical protein
MDSSILYILNKNGIHIIKVINNMDLQLLEDIVQDRLSKCFEEFEASGHV